MFESGMEVIGLMLGAYGVGELIKYYRTLEDAKNSEIPEPDKFDLGRYLAYRKLKR